MWFILDFVAIGPGLPPSAGMPEWYVPGCGSRMENGTLIEVRSVAEHFELIGDRIIDESPSCFPAVSQYCGYANCRRTGSDDQYLIASWYFDDSKKFSRAEVDLYQYLEERGRVSTVELNISEDLKRLGKEREYTPDKFNVTGYESETTSGYFLVYKNPFGRNMDEFFIVYYGSMGSVDLPNQTPFLKELIADGYYLNVPGTVGSL
ncbi:MAG: hypothetical protein GQ469_06760 [Methanosarcinales archaeon]|nr:hypothetical protein [Methanosarcinales archaeon]